MPRRGSRSSAVLGRVFPPYGSNAAWRVDWTRHGMESERARQGESSDADAPDLSAPVVVKFDGGSRGNPGNAGAGAVAFDAAGRKVFEASQPLGVATNNVAEYKALILGMKVAKVLGATKLQVFGDSKLVCSQMKGEWAVRNAGLRPLHKEANGIAYTFDSFEIEYIPRAKNGDADALANKAMDGESSGLGLLSKWEELHKPPRLAQLRGSRRASNHLKQGAGPSASKKTGDGPKSAGRRCHKAHASTDAAGVSTSGFSRSFPADFASQSLGRKARKYSRSVLRGGMNLFTKRAPH